MALMLQLLRALQALGTGGFNKVDEEARNGEFICQVCGRTYELNPNPARNSTLPLNLLCRLLGLAFHQGVHCVRAQFAPWRCALLSCVHPRQRFRPAALT